MLIILEEIIYFRKKRENARKNGWVLNKILDSTFAYLKFSFRSIRLLLTRHVRDFVLSKEEAAMKWKSRFIIILKGIFVKTVFEHSIFVWKWYVNREEGHKCVFVPGHNQIGFTDSVASKSRAYFSYAFVNSDNKLYAGVLRNEFLHEFFYHSVMKLKIVRESVNVKFLFVNI